MGAFSIDKDCDVSVAQFSHDVNGLRWVNPGMAWEEILILYWLVRYGGGADIGSVVGR